MIIENFRVVRGGDIELISYGPQSDLRLLIGDDEGSTPIRIALQTCQSGYDVPIHCHPYIEYLTVLEGASEFRIEADGTKTVVLYKGDTVEIQPGVWHSFSSIGTEVTHLLGIHVSPERIVNYKPDVKTDSRGFRII
jgi:mannose-6-phosphate isomerase-like protein (cupin superfamily)